MLDRKDIKLNDDGTVAGVGEAVKALLTSKPYLKGNSNLVIGTGTAPNGQQVTGQRFKLSQLQDSAFFEKHVKEIEEAQKKGLIEDDVSGAR